MTTPYKDLIEAAVHDMLTKGGATDVQKQEAALTLLPLLDMKGGIVVIKSTGVSIETPEGAAELKAIKPHLWPRPFEQSTADRAFLGRGNLTEVQKLFAEVGDIEQCHRIAKSYGKRDAFDSRTIGREPDEVDAAAASAAKPKGGRIQNPFLDDSAEGEARRIQAIATMKTRDVAALAHGVGRGLDGRPLRKTAFG